ncbi:unnamed protein product, partial [Mesorhabditis spiculigera]
MPPLRLVVPLLLLFTVVQARWRRDGSGLPVYVGDASTFDSLTCDNFTRTSGHVFVELAHLAQEGKMAQVYVVNAWIDLVIPIEVGKKASLTRALELLFTASGTSQRRHQKQAGEASSQSTPLKPSGKEESWVATPEGVVMLLLGSLISGGLGLSIVGTTCFFVVRQVRNVRRERAIDANRMLPRGNRVVAAPDFEIQSISSESDEQS